MAKSSLYAAHRAAGAASGRYKASLYDIANVGYAMEADVGIEQYKQKRQQDTYETIGAALSLAESVVGGIESKQRHKELAEKYDLNKTESKPPEPKTPKSTVKSKKEALGVMGSKKNPFELSGTGTKAVGDLFRQAKEAGIEEGSKIWGKIGEEVKEWEYIYK